jgi:hypothetical protein
MVAAREASRLSRLETIITVKVATPLAVTITVVAAQEALRPPTRVTTTEETPVEATTPVEAVAMTNLTDEAVTVCNYLLLILCKRKAKRQRFNANTLQIVNLLLF